MCFNEVVMRNKIAISILFAAIGVLCYCIITLVNSFPLSCSCKQKETDSCQKQEQPSPNSLPPTQSETEKDLQEDLTENERNNGVTINPENKEENENSYTESSELIDIKESTSSTEQTKVFNYVEQMPIYPGGNGALMRYVTEHLRYPSAVQDMGIQGIVLLRFVVTSSGKVGDVQILKSLDPSCDREAIRVVKSLPRFTPGLNKGKPVDVWFQLPVRFQLI